MKSQRSNTNEPFWEDDLGFQSKPANKMVKWVSNLGRIFVFTFSALILIGFYFELSTRSTFVTVVCIGYFIFLMALSYFNYSRRKAITTRAEEIQQRAKELTRASQIGSAIHVAGHPKLERDQRIVIALIEDRLDIFSYSDPTPLLSIPLDTINKIYTITYDDDRIPHYELIDSNAQALQLEISLEGKQWDCLFRSMKNARPIDWYHALQKAKLTRG